MRLRRTEANSGIPAFDAAKGSKGRWESADGRWVFSGKRGAWRIESTFGCADSGVPAVGDSLQRNRLLKAYGILGIDFKTRREAIAALDLLLAGLPDGTIA